VKEAERRNVVPVAFAERRKPVYLLAAHQVGIKSQAHDLFELKKGHNRKAEKVFYQRDDTRYHQRVNA
jgi:hypothetical protein